MCGSGLRVVGDRVDVEAHRARDVAGEIFGRGVALHRRQVEGAVDDHEVRRAKPSRQANRW